MNWFERAIDWLDALDKYCSRKLQEASSVSIELLLFIFAHAFNRRWGVLMIFFALPAGAMRYDKFLSTLGYVVPPAEDMTKMDKFRYGLCFFVFFAIAMGCCVTTT